MIVLNNWNEIEGLMQPNDAVIWQHSTPESYTEEEAFDFLADAMSEEPIEQVNNNEMFQTIDGRPNENYKPGVWALIEGAMRGGTKRKYRKNQELYKDYCLNGGFDPVLESSLCNFFHDMLVVEKKFGPGSVWSVYSCINHWFARNHNVNLNTYRQLMILLKAVTKWYVPKKSDIISTEKVMELFERLNIDDPYELQTLVWSSLCYYGLLRNCEVLEINIEDVKFDADDRIWIDFDRATKTRKEGFNFVLPDTLTEAYRRYMGQLDPNCPRDSRFLKNMHPGAQPGSFRTRNQGKNQSNRLRWIERFLGLPEGSITAHTWRRSAATSLADSGISTINLKRAGRWRSTAVAEGYIENSAAQKKDNCERLQTGARHRVRNDVSKKLKNILENIVILTFP